MSRRCKWAASVLVLALAAGSASAQPGVEFQTVAQDLDYPWSLAFLPDGRLLVTERNGTLQLIANGKKTPVEGTPQAYVAGQGGLFDVLLHPDFAQNQMLYLSYAHGTAKANATRVVRGRLEGERLLELQEVFTAQPMKSTAVHYGGRMAWLPDGSLIVTLGDGFNYREQAQKLDDHLGTIVRLQADGKVPEDNPFLDHKGALPEIYSYGHRNVQGLVYDPESDRLYAHEHGPRGGDELNIIEKGRNYGWPVITYGVDYSGARISPYTQREGMEQPLLDWTPSIAPTGMTLYRGSLFPQWNGDLLVATVIEQGIRRVDLQDGKVIGQEVLFQDLGRVRDVRTGPDGAVYLLTDSPRGKVLRMVPRRGG